MAFLPFTTSIPNDPILPPPLQRNTAKALHSSHKLKSPVLISRRSSEKQGKKGRVKEGMKRGGIDSVRLKDKKRWDGCLPVQAYCASHVRETGLRSTGDRAESRLFTGARTRFPSSARCWPASNKSCCFLGKEEKGGTEASEGANKESQGRRERPRERRTESNERVLRRDYAAAAAAAAVVLVAVVAERGAGSRTPPRSNPDPTGRTHSMCRMGSSPPPRWDHPVTAPPTSRMVEATAGGGVGATRTLMNPSHRWAPSSNAYPSHCFVIESYATRCRFETGDGKVFRVTDGAALRLLVDSGQAAVSVDERPTLTAGGAVA
ncbi:hypothetical protein BHM03_00004800 [Ensete ventricosum]|nr:hypothetical protein BHM03_00004800 [Ensete ventricosum]